MNSNLNPVQLTIIRSKIREVFDARKTAILDAREAHLEALISAATFEQAKLRQSAIRRLDNELKMRQEMLDEVLRVV